MERLQMFQIANLVEFLLRLFLKLAIIEQCEANHSFITTVTDISLCKYILWASQEPRPYQSASEHRRSEKRNKQNAPKNSGDPTAGRRSHSESHRPYLISQNRNVFFFMQTDFRHM